MTFKDKFKNFFTVEDEYEYLEEEVVGTELKSPTGKNVVNLAAIQQPNSKVVLCEPRSYSEVQEVADHIINYRAVIINLQRVDHTQAKRIVDFLSGTVYAIKGDIQKLGEETFLCTPDNVEVSGEISNATYNEDELEKGW